ncbi:MAG: hypothetical protein ACRDRX_01375 [Pseudonocardiaceae bacterium]
MTQLGSFFTTLARVADATVPLSMRAGLSNARCSSSHRIPCRSIVIASPLVSSPC